MCSDRTTWSLRSCLKQCPDQWSSITCQNRWIQKALLLTLMFWEAAHMAGPKGVVNLLQQFLKTGASSGTLDAALGACKVRTGQFLQKCAIWWWFLHKKCRYCLSKVGLAGVFAAQTETTTWYDIININIEIILNINMYRAISGFLSLYVWQPEIHSFTERESEWEWHGYKANQQ